MFVCVCCVCCRDVWVRVLSLRDMGFFVCAACVVKPRHVGRRMSRHAMTHASVCDVCWDARVCISLCQCGLGVRGQGGCCLCCLCVWGVGNGGIGSFSCVHWCSSRCSRCFWDLVHVYVPCVGPRVCVGGDYMSV
jgi:hypothetical protein